MWCTDGAHRTVITVRKSDSLLDCCVHTFVFLTRQFVHAAATCARFAGAAVGTPRPGGWWRREVSEWGPVFFGGMTGRQRLGDCGGVQRWE